MSETVEREGKKLVAFATFPKDQRFTIAIEPLPGRMLSIETVGGMLVNLSKMLKASAKAAGPEKRIFVLAGIRLSDEGRFEADVVELLVKDQPKAKRRIRATGVPPPNHMREQ